MLVLSHVITIVIENPRWSIVTQEIEEISLHPSIKLHQNPIPVLFMIDAMLQRLQSVIMLQYLHATILIVTTRLPVR
jgi:hypothetical protein